MKSFRASLEDGVNVAAPVASLGSIVQAGLNLEFLHHVGTGQRSVGQFGHVVIGRTDAFDLVVVVILALPIHLNADIAAPQ